MKKLLLNKVKFVVIGNRVVQYKTNVEKGIYFITLENGSERLVKKVIVK